jgi:iron-sulfur cluster repair protein YtfE (RIC family)
MDALTLLTQDHEELRRLFQEIGEATGPGAFNARARLFQAIREELEVHSDIEEEIFYPAMKDSSSPELRRLALEAFEEHRLVDDLLEELQDLTPNDEEFESKLDVLREQVLRHAESEEREMFAEAKKAFEKESLDQLGRDLAKRRRALETQPAHR